MARDKTGAVLLVKRPDKGLLASMLEPPQGDWTEKFPSPAAALSQAPFAAAWKKRPGVVRHGFTHFELEIEVYVAEVAKHPRLSWPGLTRPSMQSNQMDSRLKGGHDKLEVRWVPHNALPNVELPTVMRKIVEHGLDNGGPLFAAGPAKKTALRKP